jgi:hypothetical protein
MKRNLLIAAPFLAGLLISGCWVTWEGECAFDPFGECWGGGEVEVTPCPDGDGDSDWEPDPDQPSGPMSCVPGSTRYCDSPTYCSWGEQRCNDQGTGWGDCYETATPAGCYGYIYDPDCCVAVGACCQDWYDSDWDGSYDDSVGDCEEVPTCASDTDCAGGYCSAAEGEIGLCIPTGTCASDADCAAYGPGLGCDDRGICAPEEAPCPDGECGCESDDECGDGLICVASLCTSPDAVCFYDLECGDGGLCLDNECHASCADDAACPTGQTCSNGGLCLEPAVGSDGCVFSEDCGTGTGGFECINATCHAVCASAEECAEGETCQSGVCRASTAPVRECGEGLAECATDMICHQGLCRLPCVASINCRDELSVCGDEGFCVSPDEVAPECTRGTDCADGQVCLSNRCSSL